MKILFVHNYYQQAGGEDNVVTAEMALLKNHQHVVNLWSMDNNDLAPGVISKLKTAWQTKYSTHSRNIANNLLADLKPDLVHIHNFFPQISPSIYDACLDNNIPVVQSLHNFRLICPGAMLIRNGKICHNCISGNPYQAAWYKCYKDSRLGSLVVADMVAWHRKHGTWHNKVNRFIALTEFAKSQFVSAGFPADKIAVKPNFIPDPLPTPMVNKSTASPFALFVGRINAEKGIKTLLNAWQLLDENHPLTVAGDGPLFIDLLNQANVTALGHQQSVEISQLMQQAAFLILPSEWYEGFPLVLVEALAHGLPVLASRLGSMAEIIQDGENGLLFSPGDAADLAAKIKYLFNNPAVTQKLANGARLSYLQNYATDQNYQKIMQIYAEALQT